MIHIKSFEGYTVGDDESGFEAGMGEIIAPETIIGQATEVGQATENEVNDPILNYAIRAADGDMYKVPKLHWRELLRNRSPLFAFKKWARTNLHQYDNDPTILLSWAAECGRKDVISYLYGLGVSFNVNSLKRWITHTTKLTGNERRDMIEFLDNLEN